MEHHAKCVRCRGSTHWVCPCGAYLCRAGVTAKKQGPPCYFEHLKEKFGGGVQSLPKAPRHDVHKYLARDGADMAQGSADVAWLSDMVCGIRGIILSIYRNLQAKER